MLSVISLLLSKRCEVGFFMVGAAFELPTSWANMDEKENIKVVLLQQNNLKYREIEKSFKLGTGGKYRIVQVSVLFKKRKSNVLNSLPTII